jgi:sugar (glycoside-pentoside-hexuronide) transporter
MNKKLKMKEIMGYSFGLFGLQAIIGFSNSYQAQFFNKILAADLAVIGIIMLIAKLISSFADPFIGNYIDRINLKGGKLRPHLLLSLIPLTILTILLFLEIPFSGAGLYVYIFLIFTLWSIAMTYADIPSQGMLSMLTTDLDDRNKLAGYSNFIKNVGLSLCITIMPIICILSGSEGGAIGYKEFVIGAIVMSLILVGLFVNMFFVNKENVPYQSNKISNKEMFHMLKDNKPLMLILLSALLGFGRNIAVNIQAQAAHALVGTITLFGMEIGGENTILLIGGTAGIATAIGMIFVPIMAQKLGVKKTFFIMSVYGIIASSFVFIIYILGVTSLLYMVIGLFFVGLMYGSHTFLPLVMVADCVDYYEYKTGKRAEGVHYAVLSFSIKVSSALSVALGLILLGVSGYDANNNVFSQDTKNIIFFVYAFLPGLFSLLSMIPILFYKLDKGEKQKIAEELERRHAAAAEN